MPEVFLSLTMSTYPTRSIKEFTSITSRRPGSLTKEEVAESEPPAVLLLLPFTRSLFVKENKHGESGADEFVGFDVDPSEDCDKHYNLCFVCHKALLNRRCGSFVSTSGKICACKGYALQLLSALPVFLSTFMPGHGPSRRNYQDQDQDQEPVVRVALSCSHCMFFVQAGVGMHLVL